MKAEQIDGFMEVDELADLRRHAAGSRVVVEVGSWHGRSTCALAEGNACQPGGVVYAIDHFRGTPTDPCQCARVRLAAVNGEGEKARRAFKSNLAHYLQAGRVVLWERESTAAADLFLCLGELADLLFIDGSHDAPSLCRDLDAWLPCLRPGGTLLLHDRNYPSVQEAVRDRLPNRPEDLSGSLWKWVKP